MKKKIKWIKERNDTNVLNMVLLILILDYIAKIPKSDETARENLVWSNCMPYNWTIYK